jgi:hypothetical protein
VQIFPEYYRTPLLSGAVSYDENLKGDAGFFHFGEDIVCYGNCSSGVSSCVEKSVLFDAIKATRTSESQIRLPFNARQVIKDLRMEHYVKQLKTGEKTFIQDAFVREAYYIVREYLPNSVRRHLQKTYLRNWQDLAFPHWPVDFTVDSLHERLLYLAMKAHGYETVPFIWFWPKAATGCLLLTHDVEAVEGRDFTSTLMDIDSSHGFTASFQVVPEKRYDVPASYVTEIRDRGFEFNIHDLNHDGRLFKQKDNFLQRAKKINEYAKKYEARGFRSGAMYRNLDWYDAFEFSYDMSVPNVAHLESQRGGCCTVMPYFVGNILEIPLTTCQDYSIFHILNDHTIDLWKKQIDLIQKKNGLLSFIAHPDYLIDFRCRGVYELLLTHLRQVVDRDAVWATLPREVDRWWRARAKMELIQDGHGWRIVGPQSERATLAYASLHGDGIVYTIGETPRPLS